MLPITHKERFKNLGIKPPKGVLLYGPPGTGKTLIARACAAQTNAAFLKLAGPQLVQMFIGDGAKMVRSACELPLRRSFASCTGKDEKYLCSRVLSPSPAAQSFAWSLCEA